MASDNEALQSSSYPDVIILKQVLRTPKLRDGMEYPYESVAGRIVCYEFRGIGVPPGDIGRPGDIFWDVTFPFILYLRTESAWKAWNPRASEGSQLLAESPRFRDRYLWISPAGLTWLASQSLNRAKIEIKQFHTLGDRLQKEFAAVLSSAPSFHSLALDIPANRARHDAEVARRRRLNVPVGSAPEITPSNRMKRKRGQIESASDEASLRVPEVKPANENRTMSEEKPHIATCQPSTSRPSTEEVMPVNENWTMSEEKLHIATCQPSTSRPSTEEVKPVNENWTMSEEKLHIATCQPSTSRPSTEEVKPANAHHAIEKMQKDGAKRDEELEELRRFKVMVSGLVGEMDIPSLRKAQ
ncbi:hypothetical protein B0H17DRAFT_1205253 [Mycena rosella]|uniref:Uncharacterized protein n=1 Tax=Mycena rosella TaxID=1033263 RepID=A0AAD7D7L1_MYCRO|nr:hypothetical protein B0H17DRAFT_1205253 [Mycena rosella]